MKYFNGFACRKLFQLFLTHNTAVFSVVYGKCITETLYIPFLFSIRYHRWMQSAITWNQHLISAPGLWGFLQQKKIPRIVSVISLMRHVCVCIDALLQVAIVLRRHWWFLIRIEMYISAFNTSLLLLQNIKIWCYGIRDKSFECSCDWTLFARGDSFVFHVNERFDLIMHRILPRFYVHRSCGTFYPLFFALMPSNTIFQSIVQSTSRWIAQEKEIWRHKLKWCGDQKDRSFEQSFQSKSVLY